MRKKMLGFFCQSAYLPLVEKLLITVLAPMERNNWNKRTVFRLFSVNTHNWIYFGQDRNWCGSLWKRHWISVFHKSWSYLIRLFSLLHTCFKSCYLQSSLRHLDNGFYKSAFPRLPCLQWPEGSLFRADPSNLWM